jgi:flagellar hook-associated protein 1 FlgK
LHICAFRYEDFAAKVRKQAFYYEDFAQIRLEGGPSKSENHTKYIALKGVVPAELGSEFCLISLKPLAGHGRSRDRAVRVRRGKFALPAAGDHVAQLSQLVGLNQISTENNGVTLTTSSGAVLVSGGKSFAMSTTQVGGITHVLAGVDGQDVTSNLTGGDLGGVLQARDQQLPSYESALDSLAFGIGTQVNQQNELGIDGNGNPGAALFSLPPTQSGAATLIQVATTDPSAVAGASPGEGSAGNANASALADLSSANVAGGQTASGFLGSFLGQIGSDASAATTNNSAQQATLTQLTTQRDSLSGVSLDEEAANLTQYQRAYQAAAQVFNIANSIMASALNLGVETSVT